MSPHMLMCRSCGRFVPATRRADSLVPVPNSCPECGGTEFKDTDADTDSVVRGGDS